MYYDIRCIQKTMDRYYPKIDRVSPTKEKMTTIQMANYEEVEKRLGCELPNAIKFYDPGGPGIVHVALLFNQRTRNILSYAINKRVCPDTIPDNAQITVHAEQELLQRHCIAKPKSQIRGVKSLISLRFNRNGRMGNSRVCTACANMISNKCKNMIDNVIYVDREQNWHEISIEEMCEIATPSSGDKRRRKY